jgi:hypothetical protein
MASSKPLLVQLVNILKRISDDSITDGTITIESGSVDLTTNGVGSDISANKLMKLTLMLMDWVTNPSPTTYLQVGFNLEKEEVEEPQG